MGNRLPTLFVGAILLLAAPPARAQVATSATSTVAGTVRDSTGGALPDTEIVLSNPGAGVSKTARTNSEGRYVFSGVLPGMYTLSATRAGFREASVSSFKVDVAKAYTVDIAMQVGEVTERVVVSVGVGAELQTSDATIGYVMERKRLTLLPNPTRDVTAYFELQPGVSPRRGANSGGAIAGARSDQSAWQIDGTDVSDNNQGRLSPDLALVAPAIPVPTESIEEFRVSVTNPNATFGRAAGGQFSLVTKRGTNHFHGSLYWYHQNDNLNANSWNRNRLGQQKPELKDNRFGGSIGGPIFRNKTFFFYNYEGRRFPRFEDVSRIVPTATLRTGILQFRDLAGNVVSYDLATSTACGASSTTACDPRGLGLNSTVADMFAVMPTGNDATLGDGLNTTGFRGVVDTSLQTNYHVLRLDHTINQRWRLEGRFSYAWTRENLSTPLDLRAAPGSITSQGKQPSWQRHGVVGLVGQVSSTLLNEFRFGWTKPDWFIDRQPPFPAVPSTNIALDMAILDEPVDQFPRNRFQYYNEETFQFIDNLTWISGSHTVQAGGTLRHIEFTNTRGDKFAAHNAVVGQLRTGAFFSVPAANRPPTCTAALPTNCLVSTEVNTWNNLYAATLGVVESVAVMSIRDGALNNLPLGTPLQNTTTNRAYEMYFNDTWNVKPGLTLGYGLMYQWQTPVVEKLGRQTLLINNDTCDPANVASCKPLTPESYLGAKRAAAEAGQIFNPTVAYVPVNDSGRSSVYNTDWTDWSPRVAVSWAPSAKDGFLGKVFGERKTVIRGGYSIVYNRLNLVSTVIIPILGVGFTQNVSVLGPTNGAGEPFRIGVDGNAPIPIVPTVTSPIVPATTFSELIGFQLDPNLKIGRNHSLSLTVQRELPGNMLMEVGWIARMGRRLTKGINFNAVPFFQLDATSGQTFAQAFDVVAEALRSGTPATGIAAQPWFENQLFAGATQQLASSNTANFINGNLSTLWTNIDTLRIGQGLPPFNNRQVQDLAMRTSSGRSNYNGLIFSLQKGASRGLTFGFNYTFSRSLDQNGVTENSGTVVISSFLPDLEYGPSQFDINHVANLSWVYELPLGPGRLLARSDRWRKFTEGWYLSGIYTASSGLPLTAAHSSQAYGGASVFTSAVGAIALSPISSVAGNNEAHGNVAGSGGVGTTGNPATGGTGLNLFPDPASVFNNFRHVRLSEDTRVGRGVIRGLPHWNLDLSLGKRTQITERVSAAFSFDFFNILNRVEFNDPSLSLTNPAAFGVITGQFSPANRVDGSRAIQFGLRVQF